MIFDPQTPEWPLCLFKLPCFEYQTGLLHYLRIDLLVSPQHNYWALLCDFIKSTYSVQNNWKNIFGSTVKLRILDKTHIKPYCSCRPLQMVATTAVTMVIPMATCQGLYTFLSEYCMPGLMKSWNTVIPPTNWTHLISKLYLLLVI